MCICTCMSMEGGRGVESMAASDGIDPPPLWMLLPVLACCACCIYNMRHVGREGERGGGGGGGHVWQNRGKTKVKPHIITHMKVYVHVYTCYSMYVCIYLPLSPSISDKCTVYMHILTH